MNKITITPLIFPSETKEQEEDDILMEYLSDDVLREACNQQDLKKVKYLELIVDLTENSLSNLGHKMPSLVQLKLNTSIVPSIRDLGTSLSKLQILWLSRCDLKDLDGIVAFPNLLELYISFNHIKDISPISNLEKLEVLDLEGYVFGFGLLFEIYNFQ